MYLPLYIQHHQYVGFQEGRCHTLIRQQNRDFGECSFFHSYTSSGSSIKQYRSIADSTEALLKTYMMFSLLPRNFNRNGGGFPCDNSPASVFTSPILLFELLPLRIDPRIPSMYCAPLHFWCVRTSSPISFSRD